MFTKQCNKNIFVPAINEQKNNQNLLCTITGHDTAQNIYFSHNHVVLCRTEKA